MVAREFCLTAVPEATGSSSVSDAPASGTAWSSKITVDCRRAFNFTGSPVPRAEALPTSRAAESVSGTICLKNFIFNTSFLPNSNHTERLRSRQRRG